MTFPITLLVLIGIAALTAEIAGMPRSLIAPTQSVLLVMPWTLFGVAWHRLVLAGQLPVIEAPQ